jgi:cell division protein FtsB
MAPRSKIARLPFEVREELNRRLLDGEQGPALLPWLNSLRPPGMAPLNDQNLSAWRQGEYADWLVERKEIEAIQKSAEGIRRRLEAGGLSVLDEGIYHLAASLTDVARTNPEAAGEITAHLVKLKTVAVAAENAKTNARRTDIAAENSRLERDKFKLRFAEGFLEFAARARALEIAQGSGSNADKITALISYMDELKAFEE